MSADSSSLLILVYDLIRSYKDNGRGSFIYL
jgi:hypothetical protein